MLTEEKVVVGLVEPVSGGAGGAGEEESNGLGTNGIRPYRKPPAQGWVFLEDGTVELVTYNPHQVGESRIWNNPRGCK